MAYGYNEMSFLYDSSLSSPVGYSGLVNDDNTNTIYRNIDTGTTTVVFKKSNVKGTKEIKNYLANTVERPYKGDGGDPNPYTRLLIDFNTPEYRAMRIKAADLVYLKNMGVYPINRMWILRRYADGVIVPNNLNIWSKSNCPQPIATMVGWIKPDGNNDKIFNFSFNEGWTLQTKMIHEVFVEILENEFGGLIGTGAKLIMPVPSWSQGLLFGFLNAMGATTSDWGTNNIPVGDPNVLQEAPMREGGGAGDMWKYTLRSDIQFDLETEYEQKLIGSVDPGSAMLDIIQNSIKMGTSNVKYILAAGSSIVNSLLKANQSRGENMVSQWVEFAGQFVQKFVQAVKGLVASLGSVFKGVDLDAAEGLFTGTATSEGSSGSSGTPPSSKQTIMQKFNGVVDVLTGVLNSILASTVAKYRWPIHGSIALMSGINSTPWHLTIGNPYSPILSMANIIIDTINVEGSGDLAYNDMPKRMKYNIKCHVGRGLGGQEIMQMFNNSYFRTYSISNKNNASDITSSQTPDKNVTGIKTGTLDAQKTVNNK